MMLGMNLTTKDTKVHEGNIWFRNFGHHPAPAPGA